MNEGLPERFWVRWLSTKHPGRYLTYVARLKGDGTVDLFAPGSTKPSLTTTIWLVGFIANVDPDTLTADPPHRARIKLGKNKRPAEAWWGTHAVAVWLNGDTIEDVLAKRALNADGVEGIGLRMMYDQRTGFEAFVSEDAARQLCVQLMGLLNIRHSVDLR